MLFLSPSLIPTALPPSAQLTPGGFRPVLCALPHLAEAVFSGMAAIGPREAEQLEEGVRRDGLAVVAVPGPGQGQGAAS